MRSASAWLGLAMVIGFMGSTIGVPTPAAAADASQEARQIVQELTSSESVKGLRGEKLVLPELTVSDEADKGLAASAEDFHASLETALINSGFFKVVERSQLDRILKELKLELSDLSDPEQAQRVGKLANSDLILLGEVTRANDRTRVSLRLVSIDTGVAIHAVERVVDGPTDQAPPPGAPSSTLGRVVAIHDGASSALSPVALPAHVDYSTFKVWRTLQNGSPVSCGALSPDGGTFASSGDGGIVKLWDVRSGALRPKLKLSLPDGAAARSIVYSPDGQTLAVDDSGGSVRLLDAQTGEQKSAMDMGQRVGASLAFSADGKRMAVAAINGADGGAILCDLQTGHQRWMCGSRYGFLTSMAFSPDGKTFAAGNTGGSLKLWDVDSGELLWKANAPTDGSGWLALLSFPPDAGAVVFSPDGKKLAVAWAANGYATLRVLDAETGVDAGPSPSGSGELREVSPSRACLAGPACLCFTSHGAALACSESQRLTIWDASTGQVEAKLKESGTEQTLALSADGRLMITADADGVINLWRAR